jgi:hypothetical protein
MTIEERREKIKNDIEELGILDMDVINSDGSGTMTLDSMESIINILREEENKFPYDYVKAHIDFISDYKLDIEKYIWSLPRIYQNIYFDLLQSSQNKMKEAGIEANATKKLLKIAFDPEQFFNIINTFNSRILDPYYTKDLGYSTEPKIKEKEPDITPYELTEEDKQILIDTLSKEITKLKEIK